MSSHIRAGDTVLHKPSGETWVVAFAENDRLAACGWPGSYSDITDCELLNPCSDKQHREMLERWAVKRQDDFRSSACRRQLFDLNRGYVGAGI